MIKRFKIFENFDILNKRFRNELYKIDLIIKSINEINKHKDKISYRKSSNFINNILLNSQIGKNYKTFYNIINEKVSKLPYPITIYEHETILNKISQQIKKTTDKLEIAKLNQLINLIIFYNYFPSVFEIDNIENLKFFKNDFYKKIETIFNDYEQNKKNDILNKDSLVNTRIFFISSHDLARGILLIEDIEDLNSLYMRINKRYATIFKKKIKNNTNIKDTYIIFNDFLSKYVYILTKLYKIKYFDDENNYIIISNNKIFDFIKFTGDFFTDFNLFMNFIEKHKNDNRISIF